MGPLPSLSPFLQQRRLYLPTIRIHGKARNQPVLNRLEHEIFTPALDKFKHEHSHTCSQQVETRLATFGAAMLTAVLRAGR
jgi:hypothetical protein